MPPTNPELAAKPRAHELSTTERVAVPPCRAQRALSPTSPVLQPNPHRRAQARLWEGPAPRSGDEGGQEETARAQQSDRRGRRRGRAAMEARAQARARLPTSSRLPERPSRRSE